LIEKLPRKPSVTSASNIFASTSARDPSEASIASSRIRAA
jgi:hypothetical protein